MGTHNDLTPIKSRIVGYDTKPADQFNAHPHNWRKHPQRQREAVAASLRELGWIAPVIENRQTGNLIDGHERVWQALQRGEDVPYMVVDLSPEDEVLALATFDAITGMAETDAEALNRLLAEVSTGEAALMELIAETAADAGLFLDKPDEADAEPQVSRADELQQEWQTATGQLWRLPSRTAGQEHRLICGDCTDAAVVERVMGGERASQTFTSPPYNAGISAKLRGNTSIDDNLYGDRYDDNRPGAEWLSLMTEFTALALRVSQYVFVNVQSLAGNKRELIQYWHSYIDNYADVLIWDKQHAAPAAAQRVVDSRFEFILVFGGNGSRAIGTRDFRGMVHNVYNGNPQRHNEFADIHAATMPNSVVNYFVSTFTNIYEAVYEPFCGTGTTVIECENLGRQCRAVEISPAYVAVALQRYQDAFGITPELVE